MTIEEGAAAENASRTRGPALGEVALRAVDLGESLDFFLGRLGFRLLSLSPAEEPETALVQGYGLRVRLAPDAPPGGRLRLPRTPGGPAFLAGPGGLAVDFVELEPPLPELRLEPRFSATGEARGAATAGRAGMTYRDLLPDRLGGSLIVSAISIPGGGPVQDWVHYHHVAFQMIFCRRGWVEVVYEDQGPPFRLEAGDLVLQPPTVRHRVLACSKGLEVVEVSAPARHDTWADPELDLPNGAARPGRLFGGQAFLRWRRAASAPERFGPGAEVRAIPLAEATRGLAAARLLEADASAAPMRLEETSGVRLLIAAEGRTLLTGGARARLEAPAAAVLPPGWEASLSVEAGRARLLVLEFPA